METLTDWTGQKIGVGDFIVYPTKNKKGQLFRIGVGKIVEIRDKTKKGKPYRVSGTDMGGSYVDLPGCAIIINPLGNSHKWAFKKENVLIKSVRHIFKISPEELDRIAAVGSDLREAETWNEALHKKKVKEAKVSILVGASTW